MFQLRRSEDRGHFNEGWLDTYHSFSFGEYHDPDHMGFRSLRVINEDFIAAGAGFPTHPHRDMEIITYILDGQLEHRDSMGNGSVISKGDVQRMSAGSGIQHSEFNHSKVNPAKLFQLWILPERRGLKPGYEQKNFSDSAKLNRLCLVASRDGREGSVTIHQDTDIFASNLMEGESIKYSFNKSRYGWIQLAKGCLKIGGVELSTGDGLAVIEEEKIDIQAIRNSEFLLFSLL